MTGQRWSQSQRLRDAMAVKGWSPGDVAAALDNLAAELGEAGQRTSRSTVEKWLRGDRVPSRHYAPRLCVLFDMRPEALGLSPSPTLLREIRDLTIQLMRRRQFLAAGGMAVGGLLLGAPVLEDVDQLGSLFPQREPRVLDGMYRMSMNLAGQNDRLPPVLLMRQVSVLLGQERQLLERGLTRRLAEVACHTTLVAGWLHYNVNNRGSSATLWEDAGKLASEAGSSQLQAYVLGVKSCLWSSVPRRAGTPKNPNLAIGLLDRAIEVAKGSDNRNVRAWLYARRGEERASLGDGRGAHRDLGVAYRLVGQPVGGREDLPLLPTWTEPRLTRYHGSVAQLLDEHLEAVRILKGTLDRLDADLLPQRVMTMTDLATTLARKRNPEPDHAIALLAEGVDLARAAGLGEAVRRVNEARQHLQDWADLPELRRLDEQLQLV
jgi:transcriptional regulator with XRE-family HTH domain